MNELTFIYGIVLVVSGLNFFLVFRIKIRSNFFQAKAHSCRTYIEARFKNIKPKQAFLLMGNSSSEESIEEKTSSNITGP